MTKPSSKFPKPLHSGATLVEVVITVGLLVTMLLPLIGLLSAAVKDSGAAINTSISSRISSQLIGQVQQANWATVSAWNGKEFHFSDQGVQLNTQQINEKSSYVARVKLDMAGVTNSTSADIPAITHQIRITVVITSLGGAVGIKRLDDADAAIAGNIPIPRNVQVSRALLVNMEKEL